MEGVVGTKPDRRARPLWRSQGANINDVEMRGLEGSIGGWGLLF